VHILKHDQFNLTSSALKGDCASTAAGNTSDGIVFVPGRGATVLGRGATNTSAKHF
jgi:hypothetical protein